MLVKHKRRFTKPEKKCDMSFYLLAGVTGTGTGTGAGSAF
jgi:hypothetical protein